MALVCDLGSLDYRAAWSLQQSLAEARAQGKIDDVLLLVEHPHTFTLGRSASRDHLLWDAQPCRLKGATVVEVDRGGDITYHGPGQLVAYPIRYLCEPDRTGRLPKVDYVGYLRQLEAVLIETVAQFGVTAYRLAGFTGVWVGPQADPRKLAAIGVRVSGRGVSTHGVALNLTTDLSYFAGIVPCGIDDKGVTSLADLLSTAAPSLDTTKAALLAAFGLVFQEGLIAISPADLRQRLLSETFPMSDLETHDHP
ncbi:MAG: lipoyl(octanoyl) transferase LipB [Chloroflexi bacterium]|nr:lipoyl(octanoyl) transferase LipB [Chloroflexota bacterium]